MFRRFALLYSVFSVLVLAVLVVLVVVRVNTVRDFNLQDAQTSFIRLQGRVRTALQGSDRELGPVIREYAEQVPTVRAIVLYDPQDGFQYVWTAEIDVLGFSRSDLSELRGYPTYNLKEVSQAKVSGPLDGSAGTRLYLDAIYRVLDYRDAYGPVRDSLIALLAFALLTVLIALFMNYSRRNRSMVAASDEPVVSPASATPHDPAGQPVPRDQSPGMQAAGPGRPDTVWDEPLIPESRTVEPVLEEVDLEEISTDPGEPGTLFSPVTSLSYREHLEKRLDLELQRSASNDQDLTCILVRFPDARDGGEEYHRRAREILAEFRFEDLCFEYSNDTFCVVLPNTELSSGIRQAEAFKGSHRGTMFFGLSARNGRLVESSRVLGETERSLDHAQKEPGGIVGFRPDPRKYRQYVTRDSAAN